MKKHIGYFIAAFVLGCVAALAARSAMYKPYASQSESAGGANAEPTVTTHSAHSESKEEAVPVNSICAICGMKVDPSIKPALYKGKLIGFGCRMCPEKFAREPDRYGPAALANKVVEN